MKCLFLILALAVFPFNMVFGAVVFSKDKGVSKFLAIGNPSAIRIEGKGEGPEGNLEVREEGKNLIVAGVLKVQMKTYATGISLRDRHMKDKYLEVEKYQVATLDVKEISLAKADLQKNPETTAAFVGTLELHGVQKPVQGEFTLKPTPGGYTVQAKFSLKLSDYSISVPTFAGVTVADHVEVSTTSAVEKF